MAEQNLSGAYENPYKFNAKELDTETGLYYYGARYYNPKLSIWYGVDPLAEKMPSWSPYVYTFNNPVRYTDPDGRSPLDWYQKNGTNQLVYFNGSGNRIGYTHFGSNPKVYSGSDSGTPAAQLFKDSSFLYKGEAYSNGQSAMVGNRDVTSGVQSEGKYWENVISHLGNTSGAFYSNLGGSGVGYSSPFFRADIDKSVNTEGFFGAMVNSLAIGSFNPKMEWFEAFFGFSVQAGGLADSVPGVIAEQKNKSYYGTIFTGTEPLRNNEGVNGFRMTGETKHIDNLTGGQKDSIINKNRSDSLRYLNDIHRSSDSLIMQKLRK